VRDVLSNERHAVLFVRRRDVVLVGICGYTCVLFMRCLVRDVQYRELGNRERDVPLYELSDGISSVRRIFGRILFYRHGVLHDDDWLLQRVRVVLH